MTKLSLKDFVKKSNMKDDTMSLSALQPLYNHPLYPRDSEIYSDKGFVNIVNRAQGGTHRTFFIQEK